MQETVKQDRDKYIGGSDIPVIMNLSPFKSRFDLLLEKAGYRPYAVGDAIRPGKVDQCTRTGYLAAIGL